MREIKFRFWDKRVNKFRHELGHDVLTARLMVVLLGNDHGGMFTSGLVKEDVSDHVVVQQYTGLKDKNGVEIYEGDLILSDHWASQETMVVKWDQDACMFYACLLSGGDRINMDEAEKTVVGNIFEGVDK